MGSNRRLIFAAFISGAALLATGCGPTYPKCDNDDHCSEKGEFCVNGLCQQCRENSQCTGAGMICVSSKCVRKPGYCDENIACPNPQKCRDKMCGPECIDNSECGGGEYCKSGSCTTKPMCGEGADNPQCPPGQNCMGGFCQVSRVSCGAATEPVYFDYDKYNVRGDQRAKLDGLANCLKKDAAPPLKIEGHCDERGTEEYNLALGERRAETAKRYLQNVGVGADKLSTQSWGEERPAAQGSNQAAWAKNRRTEFVDQ